MASEETEANIEERTPIEQDVYEEIREESKEILNHQITWFIQSEQDFMTLLRFNILILGGMLSILAYIMNSSDSFGIQGLLDFTANNIILLGSLLIWFLSTGGEIVAYSSLKVELGTEHLIEHLIDEDFQNIPIKIEDYQFKSAKHYTNAVWENIDEAAFRYDLYARSLSLLVISILIFGFGILFTINDISLSLSNFVVYLLPIFLFLFGLILSIGLIKGIYKSYDKYENLSQLSLGK